MEKRCYVCQKNKNINEFYKVNDKIYNICLHDRKRLYCLHNKKKSKCKICGGTDLCKHNKEKFDCKICEGKGICEHGSRKRTCVECKGSQICEHKKHKNRCKICKGSQICEHNNIKYLCKECEGKGICEHKINKKICKICDPFNHLISLQRRKINYILKSNNNLIKTNKTIDYLGCTAEFLYNYIYKQLTQEMITEGYEIDHIKPVAKFNFNDEEEIKKCCHWSNLRPLLSKDNKLKSDKWTTEDEEEWVNFQHGYRRT
jgi:hypothetical protein